MARVQTRRSISTRGDTYAELATWCEARDWTMSETVEGLVRALLEGRLSLVEVGGKVVVDPRLHPVNARLAAMQQPSAAPALSPPASSPVFPASGRLPPSRPTAKADRERAELVAAVGAAEELAAEGLAVDDGYAGRGVAVAKKRGHHFTGSALGPVPSTTPRILSREARRAREVAKKTPILGARPGGPSSNMGDPRWGHLGHISTHREGAVEAARTAAALVINRPAPIGLTPATIAQPRPLPAPPVFGLTQAPVALPRPARIPELSDPLEPLPCAIRTARRDGHTTLLG